jgi:hypothetical protein
VEEYGLPFPRFLSSFAKRAVMALRYLQQGLRYVMVVSESVDLSVISMPVSLRVNGCIRSLAAFVLIGFLPPACRSQMTTVTIPSGYGLRVGVTKRARLQLGAPVEGVLLSPIYVDTQLVLPAGSIISGIISGTPPASKSIRIWAKLDADFTPLREAIVDFNVITLASGEVVNLDTSAHMRNASMVRLAQPIKQPWSRKLKSLIGNELRDARQQVTSPGKSDRLLRLLFSQMPYHPQRVWQNSFFDANLNRPTPVLIRPSPVPARAPLDQIQIETPTIKARFSENLTSKTARAGDPVEAIVTEPVWDKQHRLILPEGSTLEGAVLKARPARSFGRNGTLRFAFHSVRDRLTPPQQLQGILTGVEGQSNANVEVDSEGGVRARPDHNRFVAPLLLAVLAAGGHDDDGGALQQGFASNGLGVIARLVGFTANNRYLATGFGAYGFAKSVVRRFLVKGHEVEFPRDTAIEAQLSARTIPSSL